MQNEKTDKNQVASWRQRKEYFKKENMVSVTVTRQKEGHTSHGL